ncbi:MAG: serine hydrolase domain-containing protein [Promethearchaeota archaeon]
MFNEHNCCIETSESLSYEMQNILDQELKACKGIGVSAAIIFSNQEVWVGTSGLSDPLKSEPIKPNTLFYIGSISKNFIAALILKLVEEKKLSLDDKIHNWLPAYRNINSMTTIRQLLNHTSGIFDYVEHPDSYDRKRLSSFDLTKVWTPEEIITTLLKNLTFLLVKDGTTLQQITYCLL